MSSKRRWGYIEYGDHNLLHQGERHLSAVTISILGEWLADAHVFGVLQE